MDQHPVHREVRYLLPVAHPDGNQFTKVQLPLEEKTIRWSLEGRDQHRQQTKVSNLHPDHDTRHNKSVYPELL